MSTVTGSVKTIIVLLLLTVVCLSSGNQLLERCKYKYNHLYPGCGRCCQIAKRECITYCTPVSGCSIATDCVIRLDKTRYMAHFNGKGCNVTCQTHTLKTTRELTNNGASFFSKRKPKYQVRDQPQFRGMNELYQRQVLSDTTDTEY